MLYIERRDDHEVEHWTREAHLLLVASHKYSNVTVHRNSSAPFRGNICCLYSILNKLLKEISSVFETWAITLDTSNFD